MHVELAAASERNESTDRAPCMRRAREEQHIGAGSYGLPGPTLDGCVVNERQRVGDRDAVEAETAEQPVRRRLERRAETRAIERLADHDAPQPSPDGPAIRREILRADARVDVRPLVGRAGRRAEAGKVLCA